MRPQVGLTILRLVLALVTGGYSLALVVAEIRGDTHHFLLLLGLVELGGAILFLFPKTIRLGGITLIVVFAVAVLFHALDSEYGVGYLAVYAAATFAVISARTTA